MNSAPFARAALVATVCALTAICASATEPDSPEAKALQKRSLGESFVDANADVLKIWFHEAPSKIHDARLPLKGLPLWHTNGELSDDKIREILEEGQKNGFGGITFLPLSKTTPKYLSDEYLKQYGKMLDVADELGMPVIFYDDVDYPSGKAGGKLKTQFPDAVHKRLDKVEWTVKGPAEFAEKSTTPLADKALYGKPAGVLQAAVALNTATNERINIRDCVDAEGNVKWSAPEGEWKVMLFVCVADPKKGLVDYMSPDAVRKFFTLTYDRIYSLFPEHFGTTLRAIFFDDITNTQTEGGRNWALEFNDKYRELWGREPDLDYPALFYSIGKETPSTRYRLWTTRNRLFADGYPAMVKKWKDDHNLDMISTGHPQGPYVIQPVDMCGDAIASHKNSDAVLFDSIHYYGHGRDGFKIPTSAAFNYDFPLCFVEIYGNYRDKSFDPVVMQRSAMEIFARGGNMLLPHGVWSDPATVYIPPEISWRNPKLKGFLPDYGEFVSRCSLLLQGGRHVADFGMLYPVDNLKAFFHFQFGYIKGDYPCGVLVPEETDYLAVGSDLTSRIWRDFTFLHPQVVDEKCKVVKKEDGSVRFRLDNVSNWEEYRALIIPGADVISLANLKKFAEFYDAGGALLATTRLPSMAAEGPEFNDQVCEIIQRIFGIDPRTQAPNKAIRTGQEDIVLPENFVKCREINKPGEFVPERPENLVKYEEPIRRERAVFLTRPTVDALRDAADYLVPKPDVLVKPAEGTEMPCLTVVPRWEYEHEGMFQYLHKVKNGTEAYFFANSSNKPAEFTATLRGIFTWIDLWDPWTGETTRIDGTDQVAPNTEEGTTTVKISLKPVTSVFILGKTKD